MVTPHNLITWHHHGHATSPWSRGVNHRHSRHVNMVTCPVTMVTPRDTIHNTSPFTTRRHSCHVIIHAPSPFTPRHHGHAPSLVTPRHHDHATSPFTSRHHGDAKSPFTSNGDSRPITIHATVTIHVTSPFTWRQHGDAPSPWSRGVTPWSHGASPFTT